MRLTKLLLFTALLFGVVNAVRAEATDDKIVVNVYDDQILYPGSGESIYVSLSMESTSNIKYSAYQVSLELPDGLEVCMVDGEYEVYMYGNGGFYPRTGSDRTGWTYKHTVAANVVEGNVLNIACSSNENALFAQTSGDLLDFYVKASPYLKPGNIEIKVKNVEFVTPDGKQYNPADYISTSVKAAATSTLTLKVSAENEFSTCILPFDYELPADGSLEAYTCNSHRDGALILNKVDKIEAYTPYILRSEVGFSATLSGAVDAAKYPDGGVVQSGYLVGTVVSQELTEGSYVMQNQGDGAKFYRVGATPFAIPAGKCYVEMPAGTQAASFRIGATTSIENCESSVVNNELIYNLHGQRFTHMQPGNIYIVNGRTVLAK